MGWLTDKLKKKLGKRRGKKVILNFKSAPFKDITFLPATATEQELTNHVNSRLNAVVAKAGGAEKFTETDFTIMFIDKLNQHQMAQNYELQKSVSRRGAELTGLNAGRAADTYDWEPKRVSTSLKEGESLSTSQYYMIIIEYTTTKEQA